MNYYALLYYPKYGDDQVEEFRKKHDKNYKDWKSHITLIFPVSDKDINEKNLINHISSKLKKIEPFQININGLVKSWDNWLFITVKKGNNKIIKLHDELYTGILKRFLREDIEFIPHIAIGLFVKGRNYTITNPKKLKFDKEKFDKAKKDAEKTNFDYECKLDKIVLEKYNKDFKHIKSVKTFKLK